MAQQQQPQINWDDLPDIDLDNLPDANPTENESFLGRAWNTLSEPLTTLPSQAARFASSVIDDPMRAEDRGFFRPFVAGAMEGIGDVASSLTSPINLGTAALTGGTSVAARAGLPSIARAMNVGAKASGLLTAGHGAQDMVGGAMEGDFGRAATGAMEAAGGIAGVKSKVPAIGRRVAGLADDVPSPMGQSLDPNFNSGMGDPMMAGSQPYTPTTPKTLPNVLLRNPSPEKIKEAVAAGYKYEGLTDDGRFRMKYVGKPEAPPPVLETEVSGARPTRTNARQEGQLGPKTDVKKSSMMAEAFNFPRAVMASMDFSAPLRQGLPLIHKKEFWSSIDDMFKAWGSEDAFRAIQDDIANRPLFKPRTQPVTRNGKIVIDKATGQPRMKDLPSFADDAGLKLTDLTDLTKREEAMMSTWAEKIPLVRRSNRAYTAFLNKLRADTFETLVKEGKVFGADAKANLTLARDLADFVNNASGRGNLGKLEQSAVALNSTFFSPRLIASRLNMFGQGARAAFSPQTYNMSKPSVRREYIKSLLAVATAGNVVGQMVRMSGLGTVEADPTSSDFGKAKVGSVRLDPFAGFQQYVVAANRLIQGRTKSSTTGREYNLGEQFGRPTRLDVLGRFAEGKLNPVLSFATGMLRGKDFTGQPFNVPEEVASRFIPIFVQDVVSLLAEEPDILKGIGGLAEGDIHPENLPFAIPSMFGMGIQEY